MNHTFNATSLSRAWLSVALASSTNTKDPPLLYRTVAIEDFANGVRLVATDKTMILTAWVPDVDTEFETASGLPPEFDEPPKETVVAMDTGARASSLLGYALDLGGDDRPEPLQLGMAVGPAPESETGALSMPGDGPRHARPGGAGP